MFDSIRRNRAFQLIGAAADAIRVSEWTLNRFDPAGLRYVATVSLWVHWFIIAACFILVFYRPPFGPPLYAAYWLIYGTFVGFNAYLHYRLASGRTITWRWIFAHYVLDAALVSAAAVVGGGFSHYFMYMMYFPVLACFAVFFSSFKLNLAYVTTVAVTYLLISLFVGEGIDLEAREEKPLFARIVVMYAVVAAVNVISRFERTRWMRGGGKGAGRCGVSGQNSPKPFTIRRRSRHT